MRTVFLNPSGGALLFFRLLNALCLAGVIALGAYYTFFEAPFLSYGNLPFPVLTPRVHAGGTVLLDVRRCNRDSKTRVYAISHQLVGDTLTILLPAVPTSIQPGCSEAVSAINVIPTGTPAGTYHIEGYAEVQGTLRAASVAWSSQPFEVVQGSKP